MAELQGVGAWRPLTTNGLGVRATTGESGSFSVSRGTLNGGFAQCDRRRVHAVLAGRVMLGQRGSEWPLIRFTWNVD